MTARAGRVSLVGAGPGRPRADHGEGRPAPGRRRRRRLRPARRAGPAGPGARERRARSTSARSRAAPRCRRRRSTRCWSPRRSRGATVVRLKGGDPFVFGRGGEELLACVEAGVAVEVVPGITSAVAAPGAAGIPVTHRGLARSFAVVTGSTAHGEDTVDLARMATATDTLVVLMAAGKLAETCADADRGRTAAARARRDRAVGGRRPSERSVVGTLADLPALAAAATIGPPATLDRGRGRGARGVGGAHRRSSHRHDLLTRRSPPGAGRTGVRRGARHGGTRRGRPSRGGAARRDGALRR